MQQQTPQQPSKTLHLSSATVRAIQNEMCRRDFYEFRKRLAKMSNRPFVDGWWQREVSRELEQFLADYLAGKRPKLIIKSPPQHGKSTQLTDFIIWTLGKYPSLRCIFAAFSDRLGKRCNAAIQRAMGHPDFAEIFPNTKMGSIKQTSQQAWRPKRNDQLIEFWHYGGSFRNTTTGGAITGESLDLGFIDDPIKGREEANSETIREKKWEWFTDDFFTRFADNGAFICIGTNWHIDDPIQRMTKAFPDVKVISYPAIAINDEEHRKAGEPLFPELKSLEFLLSRKKLFTTESWEALYQQNPIVIGGMLFKDTMIDFRSIQGIEFDYEFITVDTAYKEGQKNDFTVFSLWGMVGGELYLKDVFKQKMNSDKIEAALDQFITRHQKWQFRNTWIEPKGHGIYLNQKFALQNKGIPMEEQLKEFFKDRRLDKVERANNAIPHLVSRKVHFNEALAEKEDLKSECLQFPNGIHDDFVDTLIDGIKVAFGRTNSILDVL